MSRVPYTTRKGIKQFKPKCSEEEAFEGSAGFCLACGQEAHGVEPDARKYECEGCGMPKVFGLENIKSVAARYPRDTVAELPGPGESDYVITRRDFNIHGEAPDLAQVFKSADCYSYQSCEHDGWESSEAHAFIEALRSAAWCALPGYEEAEWGAPERKKPAFVAPRLVVVSR